MEDMFKEHRYLGKIDEAIVKGKRDFFLYGQAVLDYSLFNTHLGNREIEHSLFLYFYNVKNIELFVVVSKGQVKFYNKDRISISSQQAFAIKNKRTGRGVNVNPENNEKINEQAADATSNLDDYDNNLHRIEQNLDKKKMAIFFNEFEYEADLYKPEPKLHILQRITNWSKSDNSYTVVLIKNPDLLKNYGFDIEEDADNMIYLGNPSQIEISKAYRRYIYTQRPDIEIVEDDFEDIVSAIQASKKNLRESVRVLKYILKECANFAKLTKDLFEASFTKTIEEKVTFEDVILNSEDKKDILSRVDTFCNDKKNKTKGFIMTGPPGTGKTYIAKAIAHEHNMNFMSPTLADLKGEHIGHTSGKVKRFFEEARANSPTVIFLDEIDTIFTKRDSNENDSFLRDMVNQFLVEIDGVKTGEQDIFIIGATNRIEVIDSAILSRLPKPIYIGLPDKGNREKIFDIQFENFKLSQQPWKEDFLNKTESLSGRDINNFAKLIKALDFKEEDLSKDIFYAQLKTLELNVIEKFRKDMSGSIEIMETGKIKFDDVVGYEAVKDTLKLELDYVLSDYKKKEQMKTFNITPSRGNLLYGPPGNGKTTFAEALAGEHDFYYIKILSKDFASAYSEGMLKKIELIFANTIKLSKMTNKAGVVLFFDEIDTLIAGKSIKQTVRGTLLNYLENKEGIKAPDSKVILIAATNTSPIDLDSASIREGRFDTKLKIDYPSEQESIDILKSFFENDKQLELIDLDDVYYEDLYSVLCGGLEENKGRIPTVNLKGVKNRIKRQAFENESLNNNKIVIKK